MSYPPQPDERLNTVLHIAQLGFWEMRMQDKTFTLSDEACAIFGLAPGSEVGKEGLLQIAHPADRELVATAVDRALGGQAPLDLEHRVVHPNGEVRHVHARGLLTEMGGTMHYLGTVQ